MLSRKSEDQENTREKKYWKNPQKGRHETAIRKQGSGPLGKGLSRLPTLPVPLQRCTAYFDAEASDRVHYDYTSIFDGRTPLFSAAT
jgi:hypothetical protein